MSSASETYWNNFHVNIQDVERLYAYLLEKGHAASSADLARVVITARSHEEQERRARLNSEAQLYQPKNSYAVGQRLLFSTMNDAEGTVSGVRASDNPRVEPYQ